MRRSYVYLSPVLGAYMRAGTSGQRQKTSERQALVGARMHVVRSLTIGQRNAHV